MHYAKECEDAYRLDWGQELFVEAMTLTLHLRGRRDLKTVGFKTLDVRGSMQMRSVGGK